ncbi:MAG: bifunctional 2-C-methyl-D-erythritol 4-phosphate cytidylyltransferase/2-C-methyl-D-erythritol 2,4-cyclodiphosphate synthase [Alphaproteobacteria bacterium]
MTRTAMPRFAALIVAAGQGNRAGRSLPKQYELLAGVPLLRHAIDCLRDWDPTLALHLVIAPGDDAQCEAAIAGLGGIKVTDGGTTRQQSVLLGLRAMAIADPPSDLVMIHDGARPFCSPAMLARLADAVGENRGAVPAVPVSDTLYRISQGQIADPMDRTGVSAMQTPQVFPLAAILAAHESAADAADMPATDDVAIARRAGLAVAAVPGDPGNIKITWPEDFAIAEARLLSLSMSRQETRTGQGFDVHAFTAGDHVTLCGVEIPHDRALAGHSDSDVGLHALTDAFLGALADGDIGAHFPPSDVQWAGAASDQFLADAVSRIAARGGRIVNCDVTIICETPKIGPHRDTMRTRIAAICGIDVGRVAVKATTTERLGFAGRGEGIAAQAIATVELPVAPAKAQS